ncbi:MAG: chromate transporter, partial [Sphaerochaeta sp.]|nr:chromate transporter [Sphaerochaeta sp.]
SLLLATLTHHLLITLFEAFYRYGYLVFGGGQVVVPVMIAELVETKGYMSNEEFLTGYGLVQGLPGPMFSFSAYAGGMAARGQGTLFQIAAALLSAIGIFLPGTLLIFFVYPVWEKLKGIKAVRLSLRGINAVAGGLITTAAILLLQKSGLSLENFLILLFTVLLLLTRKIPAPLIVLATLGAGILL